MDNKINLLITLTEGIQLLRVAIKITPDMLKGDVMPYYLEPENKAQIAKLLPEHCKSGGYNIVEVQEIFEIKDLVLSAKIHQAIAEDTLREYKEALIWCSGSEDFQVGGKAREGWEKICVPLLEIKKDI